MRIPTDGEYDWCSNLYDRAAEGFDVGTKSDGIDAAYEFSTQMLRNPERAAEHEDITEDPAAVLPTANVTVKHQTITDVEISFTPYSSICRSITPPSSGSMETEHS
jgi:hypothetical protein